MGSALSAIASLYNQFSTSYNRLLYNWLTMIGKIALSNFRNFDSKVVEFTDGVTLIIGPNASGKTNILESLFLLSTGRSFKAKVEETIHHLETTGNDIVYINEDGSKEVWPDTTKNQVLADAKVDLKECDLALERIEESLRSLESEK